MPRSGKTRLCASVWLLGLVAAATLPAAEPPARRPNVVWIMTDNHGPWTLGCYGNPEIRTPNIDRLARRGMLFTHCYSSNAVCSPTRATWLTGLMPSQHGVHCFLAPWVQLGPRSYSTIQEFRSLPELLAEAGYTCGLVGKWHLGANDRPQEGFTFWVAKPEGHTREFYGQKAIEHGRTFTIPGYQTEYWTRRAVEFIRRNRSRPFFLFLAYNGPYGLSPLLLSPGNNRHREHYAGLPMRSFPREPMHPWLYNNRDYLNNLTSMRRYAAEISGVDDGVGQVLRALRELGLEENTLVVFCADQGLAGGQGGIWGMGDHTRPLSAFDSTMHVPLIVSHPGHIPQGTRCRLLVSNYDWYPTLLEYLGLEDPRPDGLPRPGRSLARVLRHGPEAAPRDWADEVFYEFETVRAVRTRRWKLVVRLDGGPTELYDLEHDPGERRNLAGSARHRQVEERLRKRLQEFFARYADPRYDLSRGGKSKAGFLLSSRPAVVRPSLVSGVLELDATTARLQGGARRRFAQWPLGNLRSPADKLRWQVAVSRPRRVQVQVKLLAAPPGAQFRVTVGRQILEAVVDEPLAQKISAGDEKDLYVLRLGTVDLPRGTTPVELAPAGKLAGELVVRWVRLVPSGKPAIRKLGTIDLDLVETTPVVFQGKLYRFESVRTRYRSNRLGRPYYRFVEVATGRTTPPFGKDHDLGSALVHEGTMYVFGPRGWGTSAIDVFWSRDLKHWQQAQALKLPGWELYNTSVCRTPQGFVMALEVGGPPEVAGVRFTARFAVSQDLRRWKLLPEPAVFTKKRYSACPTIRYLNGYYYMTYLERTGPRQYNTFLVRSRDLKHWESSPLNPFLQFDQQDKRIGNPRLDREARARIAAAYNCNNSDVDFCQFGPEVVIYYSWGNQRGVEFLAEARYRGTLAELLEGFFPPHPPASDK